MAGMRWDISPIVLTNLTGTKYDTHFGITDDLHIGMKYDHRWLGFYCRMKIETEPEGEENPFIRKAFGNT